MTPAALALFSALALLGGRAFGHPVKYDQRQEGELNVRTDVEDVLFVVVPPQDLVAAGMGLVAATAADFLRKNYGGIGPERWPLRTPPKLGFASVEKSPYKIDLEKTGFQVKKIQQAGDPNRYNFHEGKNPTKSAPTTSTRLPEKSTTEAIREAMAEVQSTTENKTVKKELKPSVEPKKKPETDKTKVEEKEPPKVIGEGAGEPADPTSIFRHEGCGPDAVRNSAGKCVYQPPNAPPE